MNGHAKKNIWLIKVAEPVPGDGSNTRLMRTGLLGKMLADAGHTVTWWQSTVAHQNKKQRYDRDTLITVSDNFRIYFIHAPLYKKSIGLPRLINQYETARKFRRAAEAMPPPDVIVCCLPTLDLCAAALRYGKRHGVPVMIDVRDLWPDAFLKFAPAPLKPVWRRILTPLFRRAEYIFKNADAIVGVTEEYLNWGLAYAGREKTARDACFPFGYPSATPGAQAVSDAEARWRSLGVGADDGAFTACFFGFFGMHFELETVIAAARLLSGSGSKFKFVLCGSGDNLERFRGLAAGLPSVALPGWVGEAEIWTLMRKSAIGLAPYRKSQTFIKNFPNKIIEYLSAGLPVVSSLEGLTARKLSEYGCGITYAQGDAAGLAGVLAELRDNPGKTRAMAERAAGIFQEHFSAEKVYGAMIRHITALAEKKAG